MRVWLALAATLAAALALPTTKIVFVGQLISLPLDESSVVEDASGEALPQWLIHRDNTLQGIPAKDDVGKHFIKVTPPGGAPQVLELIVKEEEANPCKDADTYWIENRAEETSLKAKIDAVQDMADNTGFQADAFRTYSLKYSRSFRSVEFIGEDLPEGTERVVSYMAGCDLEDAVDTMSKMMEEVGGDEDDFEPILVKGRVLPRKQRDRDGDVLSAFSDFNTGAPVEETTTTPVHTTTRRSVDHPPARINSISTINCIRGAYCQQDISTVFTDAEDGNTGKLKLTVASISSRDKPWMTAVGERLEGVSLEEGKYEFRLEARDKKGQMASAPFSVVVKAASPTAHLVRAELESPSLVVMQTQPEQLPSLIRQLARAMGGRVEEVRVHAVEKSDKRAVVVWSNATLAHRSCPHTPLAHMNDRMLAKNGQVRTSFVRAVGKLFHVRSVKMVSVGACDESGVSTSTPVGSAPAVTPSESSVAHIVLTGVGLLLLLLVALLCLLCCVLRRSRKTKQSAYVSKGKPVVFPEEVGEDEEKALASTPMLVREERAPLKVSQHDNPLYRPPPPVQPTRAAPPPGAVHHANPAQRLPPPYVPP